MCMTNTLSQIFLIKKNRKMLFFSASCGLAVRQVEMLVRSTRIFERTVALIGP